MNRESILFWLRRNKMNKKGFVPVYYRITVEGKRIDQSCGVYVNPNYWDTDKQRVNKLHPQVDLINGKLQMIHEKIYLDLLNDSLKDGTASFIRIKNNHTLDKEDQLRNGNKAFVPKIPKLLELFDQWATRQGQILQKSTVSKYMSLYNILKHFIKLTYRVDDIHLDRIDQVFTDNFIFYLRTSRNSTNTMVYKYVSVFRNVLKYAKALNLIPINYFELVLVKKDKEKNVVYLPDHEFIKLQNAIFDRPTLNKVLDIFLFQCYTGLSYTDVSSLRYKELYVDSEGLLWIIRKRNKNGNKSTIPVLPQALKIMKMYNTSLFNNEVYQGISEVNLLPVISNQKMNFYLKEIQFLLNIPINLTTHVARRTFATLILNSGSVSIETVAAMLGHSSTNVTQRYYTETSQNRIKEEMKNFGFFGNASPVNTLLIGNQ